MVNKPEFRRNMLDELLEWLDPDRQVAGRRYEEIRRSLVKIFVWRKCSDAEGMADDVIDRVAAKVRDLKGNFEGNPQRYFFGVARNLFREYQKTVDIHVPLSDMDLPVSTGGADQSELELEDTCLSRCLQRLPGEQRQQIIQYYGGDKHEKIRARKQLADDMGIGQNALRVRMHRIRATLEICIENCLSRWSHTEMD
jgi:DNA-directed RNA polymerase specialized sigma24 family protein